MLLNVTTLNLPISAYHR